MQKKEYGDMQKNVLGIAGIMALGAAFAAPVMAAEGEGFFASNTLRLGAGIGLNYVKIDDAGFDEHGTALEGFVGYEFNRWLAVEAGYLNGGNAAQDYFDGAVRLETEGFYASVLGSLPITDAFGVYARAGFFKWDAEVKVTFDGQEVARGEDDGSDPMFGIGAAAQFDGAMVRLEYRMADIDDVESRLIGVSIVWPIPLGR